MFVIIKFIVSTFFILLFSASVFSVPTVTSSMTKDSSYTEENYHHAFANLQIVKHPLILHKLTQLRMKETKHGQFYQNIKEIGMLLGYEATKHLPIKNTLIETPLANMNASIIADEDVVIVPVLRAGLGMAEGLRALMPNARMGHIGLYRDHETKQPVQYLVKLPKVDNKFFIVVEPMLATGGSIIKAIDILVTAGVPKSSITCMVLVAAPEGVKAFSKVYPEVSIYAAALDNQLNENAYIVPGLGDAGDRTFGT